MYPPTIAGRQLKQTFQGGQFTLWVPQIDIMPGELTYIGGESGSGKSTLMKLLALETKADSGELWILDRQINALSSGDRDDVRGGGITYIPQGHLGLTDHTPVEAIQRLLHDYDGMSWSDAERRAQIALALVRLPQRCMEKQIRNLSGGERARVAIAKAYAAERPICLADEILPALDSESRKVVVRLFQDLAAQGFTVAIIVHQPELKDRFHRVIEMRGGQIIDDRRNAKVVQDPLF